MVLGVEVVVELSLLLQSYFSLEAGYIAISHILSASPPIDDHIRSLLSLPFVCRIFGLELFLKVVVEAFEVSV